MYREEWLLSTIGTQLEVKHNVFCSAFLWCGISLDLLRYVRNPGECMEKLK